ncbi:glycosyltransferase family 2 protein [Salinisphaera sp.]|uniref:glycosyltransferase n=1 Tax=Salinisphaera sp. TaxID=1914330 RepID=UPI0025D1C4B3|nr:glycosyltransferase family 2 protein [Salinisphaera sp.]
MTVAEEVVVVIATANRADSLRRTLESLSALDTSQVRWRLIVVNNASEDDTASVLAEYEARHHLPLVALYEPRRGKSRALNRALELIEQGLVIFVDDDVALSEHWLQAYVRGAARWPDVGMFGGRIVPVFPADAPAWMQSERYVHQAAIFGAYEPFDHEGITDAWPHGANAGIRRELIGNSRFDPRFGPGGDYSAMGDETEFVSRLIEEKGAEIVYLPEACAHHTVREEELSRAAIWARAFKWGRTRGLVEEGDKQKLRLRGVPINIWLSAARAFLRFAPYCFGPEDGYLKYGWQWQVRSGRVAGYRELRRRRRGEPNDDGAR